MGPPERISSTFLSFHRRVGVEARGLHWEEEGRDRWFKERGRGTVSSLDNERTVCLPRSDPNVWRVKITKPNIVGVNLYTVFVSVVFLCTGECSICGCDCSYSHLGWWRIVGLIRTSTSRVKRHPHGVRSRSADSACSFSRTFYLGWWKVVGLILTSTSRVKSHPHGVQSRSSLRGWACVFFLSFIKFGLVKDCRADNNLH